LDGTATAHKTAAVASDVTIPEQPSSLPTSSSSSSRVGYDSVWEDDDVYGASLPPAVYESTYREDV
jgi:hypothetical protein